MKLDNIYVCSGNISFYSKSVKIDKAKRSLLAKIFNMKFFGQILCHGVKS